MILDFKVMIEYFVNLLLKVLKKKLVLIYESAIMRKNKAEVFFHEL